MRIDVVGDLYAAYLNGSFVTSYTSSTFPSGFARLYQFGTAETFDNVVINPIPLPGTLVLMGTGLVMLSFMGWRRRKRVQLKAA